MLLFCLTIYYNWLRYPSGNFAVKIMCLVLLNKQEIQTKESLFTMAIE